MSALPRSPTVYGGITIDPVTGLPIDPGVDPRMGFPSPPAAQPGLLGKLSGAFGGPQGLMNLGANLMAQSGPSPVKQGFGSILGNSLLGNQQFQQQQGENMLQQMLLQTKIAQAKKAPKRPSDVESYEYAKANGYTGTFEQWKRVASSQPQRPSAIEEYEYWKSLPTPEERDSYLTVKRSMQPFQLGEVGGGKVVFNRATGQWEQASTVEQEAAGAGQIAAGTAAGKTTGESQATAEIDLPRMEDNARQMLTLLDRIENHPGRKAATGGSSAIPLEKLPGTASRDFVSLLGQVSGKQFLEAYNTLKGGGTITEVEGKKAETAISTIQDRGQSEGAYLQAVQDLRDVVNSGLERARKKARVSAPAAPKKRYNPATGKIE